ncbi:MAG TPA: hypothetical protein VK173_07785 [Lacibacter sp.]|nr:hypothetical protein [Lacibacter sp.]
MFNLTSNISIGQFVDIKVNDCKIVKSIYNYTETATIKIPITSRVKRADETITASADTAKLIAEGDRVQILLGYDGRNKLEFDGFVSRVNFTTPCEIECEGFSYLLRKKTYKQSFKNTTLKKLLQHLVDGTSITLSSLIPELKVDKWIMNQQTGTEVLEELKKELKVSIFFTGNELYAGLQYLQPKADVKYRLGWNVIKDGNLKLREAKNREVIVKIKGEKPDGTKVKVSVGEKGEIKEIRSHYVTDQATLTAIANAERNKLSYDGYEGKITAFVEPYCEPGYGAIIIDRKYPERAGKYIVNAIEVQYGLSGARRIVDIGEKLRD